jgi:hypothetical protein
MMPLRVLAVLAVLTVSAGCLVGELSDVPCTRDDECATAHFCDLTVGTCAAETAERSAPNLQVVGVRDVAGAVVRDPFIERQGTQALGLVIENKGLLPAFDITLEFSELRCLNLVVDELTLVDTVVPGGSTEVAFTVSPEGNCGTPIITDWFLFFSGRGSRGTFNINIRAAPPGAN